MNQVFYILLETDRIEERAAGFEGHQQVDVAIRAVISSCGRAEYTDIRCAPMCGELQDPLPVAVKDRIAHALILACDALDS